MRYFPICLDLKERPVLVVGGGTIAEGKTLQLVDAQAKVYLVSLTITDKLRQLVADRVLTFWQREFRETDLENKILVISATDKQSVNETVAKAAAARGLLCNIVDQPALCNFITPSLLTRGDLQISISTSGKSPTVAQRVKREISELIGEEYEILLEIAAALRASVRNILPTFEARRDFLKAFADSQALDLIRAGKVNEARQLAQQMLTEIVPPTTDNRLV